jgi:hypothetical protein
MNDSIVLEVPVGETPMVLGQALQWIPTEVADLFRFQEKSL